MNKVEMWRDRLATAAVDATDEEISGLASAFDLGQVLLGMIESIEQSHEVMAKAGMVEDDDHVIASSTIIGRVEDQKQFRITVVPATDEEAAEHMRALAAMREAGDEQTKH